MCREPAATRLRIFRCWSLVSAVWFILLAGCTQSPTGSSLTLGICADYPPFEFKREGQWVGLDLDIAQAIARELHTPLRVEDMDFSALIPALSSGRVDFVMAGMTVTEERKRNVLFSDPYFIARFALLFGGKRVDAHRIGIEWFNQKRIGAQLGSTLEHYAHTLRAQVTGMTVLSLGRNPVLVQELKAGRIDGVIVESAQASAFVRANPELAFQVLGESHSDENSYAIAFALQPAANAGLLRDQMNQILAQLRRSGELDRIQARWIGQPST